MLTTPFQRFYCMPVVEGLILRALFSQYLADMGSRGFFAAALTISHAAIKSHCVF